MVPWSQTPPSSENPKGPGQGISFRLPWLFLFFVFVFLFLFLYLYLFVVFFFRDKAQMASDGAVDLS
jgi:hypothetical protein